MSNSIQLLWRRVLLSGQEQWSRLRVRNAEKRLQQSAVDLAIERIVDQTNPALRGLAGYRRRLSPVVAPLLDYGATLLSQIPGPVTVDPESWAKDPLVNALFGDTQRIRRVVSGPVVRAWLKQHPSEPLSESGPRSALLGANPERPASAPRTDDLYALLVAMPEEHSQLGIELVSGQLRRDVKQTTLGFGDLEVAAVAGGMDELRETLRPRVIDLVVSIGLERIVAQEERIAALEQGLRMLRLKRKVIDPRASGLDLLLAGSSAHLAEQQRLDARIAETERDLADASRGLGDIAEYLQRLATELSHPEKDIGLERMRLWVDRMNIVRDRADPDAREISLVRARRPDRPGRIALYIRFPRHLIISADERLADVERHLGI